MQKVRGVRIPLAPRLFSRTRSMNKSQTIGSWPWPDLGKHRAHAAALHADGRGLLSRWTHPDTLPLQQQPHPARPSASGRANDRLLASNISANLS